jgi:hypothetical protein
MEAAPCGYAIWEQRLLARFPCNSDGFSASCTLSLKDPEPPRRALNLSPEPSPKEARACSRRWQRASVARESVWASVLHSGWSRMGEPQVRLVLRADGVGEPRHTRFGERAQELVEWPGRVEVGGLLFERGSDGLGIQVVEVE